VLYYKNFPTFNFLVIQSILLVYIKIKKLERWMRNKRGLNSGENYITYNQGGNLLELNCSFTVTIPISLSSAKSASQMSTKTLNFKWVLHDLWFNILLKIPWPFLSQGLCTHSFQCLKISLLSSFPLLS